MPYRSVLLTVLAGSLLTACFPLQPEGSEDAQDSVAATLDQPPAAADADEPTDVVSPQRAEIDWQSARSDFAARDLPEDSNTFGISSGSDAPPVPVLLPSQPIRAASADGTPSFKVIPMSDGYYAVFDGEAYDMIINGSDRLAPYSAGDPEMDPEAFRFEETLTGAQVSFKQYGASYLVEFNCNGRPPGPDSNCVSEDEAVAAVQDLLVSGTR